MTALPEGGHGLVFLDHRDCVCSHLEEIDRMDLMDREGQKNLFKSSLLNSRPSCPYTHKPDGLHFFRAICAPM